MVFLYPRLLLSLGEVRKYMSRETTVETRKWEGATWSAIAPSVPEAASESRRKHKLLSLLLLLLKLMQSLVRFPLAAVLLSTS